MMALLSAVEVLDVDWLDKAIVLELHGNARVSHQDLARKYDLSFNAIKKRVKTLEEVGAIQEYTVELSLNMLGADNLSLSLLVHYLHLVRPF